MQEQELILVKMKLVSDGSKINNYNTFFALYFKNLNVVLKKIGHCSFNSTLGPPVFEIL
jgi:hypothetical protein